MQAAVLVRGLSFAYPEGGEILRDLSFEVPFGARVVVLGANGVGKSTLLRVLAGKHLVPESCVRVLGVDPFSHGLSSQEAGLVAEKLELHLDLRVAELFSRRPEAESGIRDELLELLRVDPEWRMHRVSNGQRRRVDLVLSLMKAPRVLFLDEVTSDLDILVRTRLLEWLKHRADSGKMTVLFATHILDGMASWASHLLFLSPTEGRQGARLREFATLEKVSRIGEARAARPESPLLWLCEQWLTEDARVDQRRI